MFAAVVTVGFSESAVFVTVSGVDVVDGVAAEVDGFQQVLIAVGDVDIYSVQLTDLAVVCCSGFAALARMTWSRSTQWLGTLN